MVVNVCALRLRHQGCECVPRLSVVDLERRSCVNISQSTSSMRNSESVFFLGVRARGRPDGTLTQALCRAHRATRPVHRIFWPTGGGENLAEKHASFLTPPRKSANVEGHPIGSGEATCGSTSTG